MAIPKALALVLAGFTCLGARAESPDFSMKFRGYMGTKAEAGVQNGLGIGFNVGLPVFTTSKVDVELGYQYYTGKPKTLGIPANAFGSVVDQSGDTTAPTYLYASTNYQKLNVGGFHLRGMFSQPFLVEGLRWQAGLSVQRLKSTMDAVGDMRTEGVVSGRPASVRVGGWATSPEKTAVTVSPIAGISYAFNEAGGLELNFILATYKQVTLTPTFAATPQTPLDTSATFALGSKNVSTLKVELGYVFRF